MSPTAFQDQVYPHADKLFRLARRYVRDRAEAEDVVQEVLVKAWQRRADLPEIEQLEAWLMRLTRNKAIDHLRSRHRRTEGLELAAGLENGQPGPHAQASAKETMNRVQALMDQLPEKQRLVMHLRDIEQYSYQEICQSLDLSMSQVKVNIHRARQKVRAALLQQSPYASE